MHPKTASLLFVILPVAGLIGYGAASNYLAEVRDAPWHACMAKTKINKIEDIRTSLDICESVPRDLFTVLSTNPVRYESLIDLKLAGIKEQAAKVIELERKAAEAQKQWEKKIAEPIKPVTGTTTINKQSVDDFLKTLEPKTKCDPAVLDEDAYIDCVDGN